MRRSLNRSHTARSSTLEFAIHVVVGTGIFFVVFLPAIAINSFIHWVDAKGVAMPLFILLTGTEYAVVILDVVLFLVFLTKTTIRVAKTF